VQYEKFQVRSKGGVKNLLFSVICGFVQLQKLSFSEIIKNCYSVQRNLFKDVMVSLIGIFMLNINH